MNDEMKEILVRAVFKSGFHPDEDNETIDRCVKDLPEDWRAAERKSQAVLSELNAMGLVIVPRDCREDVAFKIMSEVKIPQGISIIYPSLEQCKQAYHTAIKASEG